ncbi:MAG: inositol monophosphatase [Ignavibacteriales bacterium]|nr:inositol monophosphatase [Ignavibacteriales bacterium]
MIDKLLTITKEAGNIVKEGFQTDYKVEYKTNISNLVTEIDKKSEKAIIEFIRKEFPGHGILAEESGAANENAEYQWVIDPLDGTTNFAHGFPIFGVSIGIQKNGKTVCGAVYHVMNDIMYSAEQGSGAYKNGKKIHVNENDSLEKSLLVTGFPYDIADNPHNALTIFTNMVKASRGMRRLGSASIDFCCVAEGIFDGFWEVNLQPWDICAGKFIVEEAGGKVTDFIGTPSSIFAPQILCSNGKIHNAMIEIISKSTEE